MVNWLASVMQQLAHRRVGGLEVGPLQYRVVLGAQEVLGLLREFAHLIVHVSRQQACGHLLELGVIAFVVLGDHIAQPALVPTVHGLPRLFVAQGGIRCGLFSDAAQQEIGPMGMGFHTTGSHRCRTPRCVRRARRSPGRLPA